MSKERKLNNTGKYGCLQFSGVISLRQVFIKYNSPSADPSVLEQSKNCLLQSTTEYKNTENMGKNLKDSISCRYLLEQN